MAMEKVMEKGLDNVVFILDDADKITDFFEESELDGLYLNFSDPWPKKRHARRRLTYSGFLEKYKYIIKQGGKIIFKTKLCDRMHLRREDVGNYRNDTDAA